MNIFFFPIKWSPCFSIVCQPAGHSEKIKNGHDLSILQKIYFFDLFPLWLGDTCAFSSRDKSPFNGGYLFRGIRHPAHTQSCGL
jgi:hypothetical protein